MNYYECDYYFKEKLVKKAIYNLFHAMGIAQSSKTYEKSKYNRMHIFNYECICGKLAHKTITRRLLKSGNTSKTIPATKIKCEHCGNIIITKKTKMD